MKKLSLFIFCLVLASFNLIGQTLSDSLIKNKWIAVYTEALDSSWVSPYDGMILSFESDKAFISHIFFDSAKTYNYEQKGKDIFLNDSIFGNVVFISKDSLIINTGRWMQTKYIPIKNSGILIDEKELIENHWIYKTELNYQVTIVFTEMDWGRYPGETARVCVKQEKRPRYRNFDNEKWSLINHNNSSVLSISLSQYDPMIHFVKSINSDSILFDCWFHNKIYHSTLKKIPSINENQLDSIKEKIVNKNWHISEIIDYANFFGDDTLFNDIQESGLYVEDTMLFSKETILNKELSFAFHDNYKYEIMDNEEIVLNGNWKLSNSGKQIVLDYGCRSTDFIDLFETEENSITIGKLDMFSTEKQIQYIEYYYKIKLK